MKKSPVLEKIGMILAFVGVGLIIYSQVFPETGIGLGPVGAIALGIVLWGIGDSSRSKPNQSAKAWSGNTAKMAKKIRIPVVNHDANRRTLIDSDLLDHGKTGLMVDEIVAEWHRKERGITVEWENAILLDENGQEIAPLNQYEWSLISASDDDRAMWLRIYGKKQSPFP